MDIITQIRDVLLDTEHVKYYGDNLITNTIEVFEIEECLSLLRQYLLEAVKIESVFQQVTLDVLEYLDSDTYVLVPLELVSVVGGPGSGKSHLIRRLYSTIGGSTILTPFSELKQSAYQGLRCTTLHVACLKNYRSSVLLVDEYTSCDLGLVILAALRQKARTLVVVGDPLQSWLKDDEGLSFRSINLSPAVKLLANHRNPQEDVLLLNDLFDDDMIPVSGVVPSGIELVPLFDERFNGSGIFLTLTKHSVDELLESGIVASTVRASQGVGSDIVHLFVFERDIRLLAVRELLRVALSRHKSKLYIHSDNAAVRILVESRQIPVDFGTHDTIADPTPVVCRDNTGNFDTYFPVLGQFMDLFVG